MIINQFTNMNKKTSLIATTVLTLIAGSSSAGNLNLSDEPLYLGGVVDPNIMFILDDSGSMHWENMPSNDRNNIYVFPNDSRGVYRGSGTDTGDYEDDPPRFDAVGNGPAEFIWSVRARSSHVNKLYYNPDVRYSPWEGTDSDGNAFTNMDPECALHNAYEPDADNDGNNREDPGDDGHSHDCRNLTVVNEEEADWSVSTSSDTVAEREFWPAVYYRYTGGDDTNINNYEKVEISSSSDDYSSVNRDFYPPTGNKHANRTDCAADDKCTYKEEIQNFANWYSYYRSRILLARAGIGRAFSEQSTKMRVGFASINKGASTIDGETDTHSIIRGVRKFEGTDRSDWFDLLYGHRMPRSGTPLRTALEDAGDYYTRSDNQGPWSETPGTTNSNPHLTCRQSYSVLMSDGFWNGADSNVNNSDGSVGSLITNNLGGDDFAYTASAPYQDSYSETLADVAMQYWKTDLRPNLSNEVPPNPQDPSFWQHMVTYTVGLGVTGELDPVATEAAIIVGTDPGWPEPCDGCDTENIDDMWHAAVNSRGEFFSASDPEAFANSLSAILIDLTSRTSSAASVALNSSSYVTDSTVYQARFETGKWTGQLLAYSVDKSPVQQTDASGQPVVDGAGNPVYETDADGNVIFELGFSLDWDASDGISTDHALRKIATFNGTDGKPFRWTDLTTNQKAALKDTESLLNYLRGDDSNEGSLYRTRTKLLGDIINSSPAYVGAPNEKYPDNWGSGAPENSSPYSTFKANNYGRDEVIYVGANDGMLHAFDASQDASKWGQELGAYVPNALIKKLSNLAKTPYVHEYFVDGSPEIKDAYIGSAWRSVLVSGLGAGGQGIFALDVTNPSTVFTDETSLAASVLWEFTDATDSEMGYTFGRPNIVRLRNGSTGVWAAVFGNGYNNTQDNDGDGATNDSTTGDAYLYVVNLQSGALIKKISTETGKDEDPTGNDRPNGLSSVTPIDANGDGTSDYVYAGDLFGNVWKFDLTDITPSNWDVAYKSGTTPVPLFTARANPSDATTAQPITSRVTVARHPLNYGGFMVFFGTGKYLEPGDNERTGQDTQTLYGIWDRNFSTLLSFNRNDLLQQQILAELTTSAGSFRVTSDNAIAYHSQDNMPGTSPPDADTTTPTSAGTSTHLGWYIDLINTGVTPLANLGEKIVSDPLIRVNRLIVNTLIPSKDACDFGGESWGLEPDIVNGGPVYDSSFDLNADGSFNLNDYVGLDASGNYVSVDGDGDGVVDSQFDADGDGIPDSPSSITSVAGKKIESGIAATPTMLRDTDADKDYKIDSTSKGVLEVLASPDALEKGRQSWIELFR